MRLFLSMFLILSILSPDAVFRSGEIQRGLTKEVIPIGFLIID